MTINQIRYIVEIAKNESINKAAQILYISQPTLSNAIKELETELGIKIFQRSRRGVALTADGVDFLLLCEQLLAQADMIQERYAIKSNGKTPMFQVSSQHYAFVVDAFIHLLQSDVRERFVFRIRETKTITAIEDVHLHKSELGLIFLGASNEQIISQILNKWNIDFHELCTVTPHVFIRKNHPLAALDCIGVEQLQPYPMIVYEQESGGDPMLAEEMLVLENPAKIIYVHDRGTTNNIIANTDSFNVGTGYLIPGIIPDEVTSRPLANTNDIIRLGWIHLSRRKVSTEVLQFVELVNQSLQKYHPGRKI